MKTLPSFGFIAGKYVVNTYKANATINHNIPTGDSIVAYWPRHSSSNQFPLYNSNKVLLPRERITINSLNHTSASLTGYVYRVRDTLGNDIGWWPFNNIFSNAQFAYSVLLHNPLFTSTKSVSPQKPLIKLYPNPSPAHQTLVVNIEKSQLLDITLHDVAGRAVKHVYSGKAVPGEHQYPVNLNNLASGVYILRVQAGEEILHVKTIKK
jgi:hypothetical protein